NTNARLYLRQAASLLGENPGNLSKELARLERIGIFTSAMSGKQRYYSLNKQYPLFGELKSIVFKTIGVEGALKEMLSSISGVEKAFIYGSFARDEENARSDVDLLLVGNFSEDKLIEQLSPLETKLQREINYTIYSPQEFAQKSKKEGGFLNEVFKTKIISLKG
ncbi:MAG: nucleotidyltransferase domain-containing protein, partial [Candidatus Omnitrophota bacterium]|nr:nucleotidyltransferase domain-containing protein [Candidatus Omnitrophota bacterium]